ncbi:hypothetical protein OIO90_006517 [Microbotryomycetes sp. JL221]|nr:hypothetical protein OIO90_006517 [Microbotryomycetes sp. JL221]
MKQHDDERTTVSSRDDSTTMDLEKPLSSSNMTKSTSKQPTDSDDVLGVPRYGLHMTEDELKLHKRVNFKMDVTILPLLSLLYLMNGIDRSNVGNAATSTFTQDVGMPKTAVNNAVTLFFITFILFQPLSAAIGKRLGVRIWIPILMICWGTLTIAHAWTRNEGMLIGLRLMIGLFEAGFYACSVYYLSSCYTRFDLAFRVALFYGSYAVAGAFSGVLAYGLLQIGGTFHGWQWLFIVEGVLTVLLAIFAFFWLPTDMTSAWFLNSQERLWVQERMIRDSGGRDNTSKSLTRTDVVEALKDWKFWFVLPLNIAASTPSQSFSVFLPLITQGLGYTSYRANLFAVPIYVVGAFGLFIITWLSDRKQQRGWFIMVSLAFVFTGLVMVCLITSNQGRYASLCVLQIGGYAAPPLTVAWLANNTPDPGKRALILGMNGWGNVAGVAGAQLFRPAYAPRYLIPFYVSLGLNVFAFVGYGLYRMLLWYVNRVRDRRTKNWTKQDWQMEEDNDERKGDNKLTFRYTL